MTTVPMQMADLAPVITVGAIVIFLLFLGWFSNILSKRKDKTEKEDNLKNGTENIKG
jgi:hypothetical protein